MNRKKLFIAGGSIFAAIVLIVAATNYIQGNHWVKIEYKNVQKGTIYTYNPLTNSTEQQPLKESGKSYFVSKKNSSLTYEGNDGFTAGKAVLSGDKAIVTLDPDFSDAHAAKILAEQTQQATDLIKQKYPIVQDVFVVIPKDLYNKGEWMVVLLQAKKATGNNYDTLRVLFHKNGDGWELKSEPHVALTRYNTADVPVDILLKANNAYIPLPSISNPLVSS